MGYGSYWNGYANGYWDGYNHGFNNGYYGGNYYYYNSFEHKNTYYGPRNSTASNGTGTHGRGRLEGSFGERYENAVKADRGNNVELKNTLETKSPVRNENSVGTELGGRPSGQPSKGNISEPKRDEITKSPADNSGFSPRGEVKDKTVRGSNTDDNSGRPGNWTTKDNSTPVKDNAVENNGFNGRPGGTNNSGGKAEPVRENNAEPIRPNRGNWNENNTPKTNSTVEPNRGNYENPGRPRRNNSYNETRPSMEPVTPSNNDYSSPRPSRNNGGRRNEEVQINNGGQTQPESRPRRNAVEVTPRQERPQNNYEHRQEQRPSFEQPRQESPRMQQSNPAPMQRENNSGGGRRR